MIIEENDVIEYLSALTAEGIVELLLKLTGTHEQDAQIAELIADTCVDYLRRYVPKETFDN